ncbi:hypothetical protein [Vibrio agarivorans]|uniref:Uncharacterized protein n=1 Tax=Vibrio agarivorans TaxID=153622 RepID=A0ABT7Y703_9VIBR|nr:hypothetical protein [Vibrio agarivorans]MDN2483838.1 hypothetical protein [Vibrio agarivorans]
MGKLTTIKKQECSIIRQKLEEAHKAIEVELGVKIQVGNMSYSPDGDNVTTKIEVSLEGAESKEMKSLRQHANLLGLEEKHLTQEFQMNGKTFTLRGFNPRAPKQCMLIREVGTTNDYTTTEDAVKRSLGIKAA